MSQFSDKHGRPVAANHTKVFSSGHGPSFYVCGCGSGIFGFCWSVLRGAWLWTPCLELFPCRLTSALIAQVDLAAWRFQLEAKRCCFLKLSLVGALPWLLYRPDACAWSRPVNVLKQSRTKPSKCSRSACCGNGGLHLMLWMSLAWPAQARRREKKTGGREEETGREAEEEDDDEDNQEEEEIKRKREINFIFFVLSHGPRC